MVWKKNALFGRNVGHQEIRDGKTGTETSGIEHVFPVTDRQLLRESISFDRNNLPIWDAGREGLELDEQETADMLLFGRNDAHYPSTRRIKPHDRIVLILDRDDGRNVGEIFLENGQKLKNEGRVEPCLALLDKENYVRGEVPLHIYMERVGVDRIADLIDAGQLSFTYSGLPEAAYRRLEDGMEKGRDVFAGTINGEAEYNINRNMSLTVTNFLKSDNIHVIEESHSAETAAALSEAEEEKNDRESVREKVTAREDTFYTGDYQGWRDLEYEPDDDMEIY